MMGFVNLVDVETSQFIVWTVTPRGRDNKRGQLLTWNTWIDAEYLYCLLLQLVLSQAAQTLISVSSKHRGGGLFKENSLWGSSIYSASMTEEAMSPHGFLWSPQILNSAIPNRDKKNKQPYDPTRANHVFLMVMVSLFQVIILNYLENNLNITVIILFIFPNS